MNTTELRLLYNFVHLPYKTDRKSIDELKKTLLLELKFVKEDFLLIGNITFTKNDILRLFEQIPENGLPDWSHLYDTFGFVRLLNTPENIRREITIPLDLSENKDYDLFRRTELHFTLPGVKREIHRTVSQFDWFRLKCICSYFQLFTPADNTDLTLYSSQCVLNALAGEFPGNIRYQERYGEGAELLFNTEYKQIVAYLCRGNNYFLEEQWVFVETILQSCGKEDGIQLIRVQLLLPWDEQTKKDLKNRLQAFKELKQVNTTENNVLGCVMGLFVIAVIAGILYLLFTLFSGNQSTESTDWERTPLKRSGSETPVMIDSLQNDDFTKSYDSISRITRKLLNTR